MKMKMEEVLLLLLIRSYNSALPLKEDVSELHGLRVFLHVPLNAVTEEKQNRTEEKWCFFGFDLFKEIEDFVFMIPLKCVYE
jgi:hypothetical protein